MSVLVRDACSKKVYAFIKGAPEKIFNNSLNRPHRFYQTVESLSLGGYRTIAIGYKEIGEDFIEKYQHSKRKIYEKDVIILGLLAFQNKIKDEAKETMERLKESSIKAKMITGDNIYIAIDTAIKSGILEKNKKVVILEGKNQRSEK